MCCDRTCKSGWLLGLAGQKPPLTLSSVSRILQQIDLEPYNITLLVKSYDVEACTYQWGTLTSIPCASTQFARILNTVQLTQTKAFCLLTAEHTCDPIPNQGSISPPSNRCHSTLCHLTFSETCSMKHTRIIEQKNIRRHFNVFNACRDLKLNRKITLKCATF